MLANSGAKVQSHFYLGDLVTLRVTLGVYAKPPSLPPQNLYEIYIYICNLDIYNTATTFVHHFDNVIVINTQ